MLIMPDSFKGSMTAVEATDILANEAEKAGATVVRLPLADGGEGSAECILRAKGGVFRSVSVCGPAGTPVEARYGITNDRTAVIEIAESTGITRQSKLHPLTSNTYGFGELILDALDQGIRSFILCLGGSASTDCGLGMAAALGVRFYDKQGTSFVPSGSSLSSVDRIDITNLDARITECDFTVICDVENPLYGPNGAAFVYGPQKGASPEDVQLLDDGLRHVAPLIAHVTGSDHDSLKGAGAAGGTGYGCAAFLKATMKSGIDTILDLNGFKTIPGICISGDVGDTNAYGFDLIITGEGCLDDQSLMGKVLSGILKRSHGIPVVSFCGTCKADPSELKNAGVMVVEIGKGIPVDESIANGKYYLKKAAETFFSETK